MNKTRIYTAESVTKGHPDKFCDLISDMVLDECLKVDPNSRVACETFANKGLIVVGGEITTNAKPDYKAIVQLAGAKVGYDLQDTKLIISIQEQSTNIKDAVNGVQNNAEQGAGDQGVMVGYACDETLNFMPIEYEYATRITTRLDSLIENGDIKGIGSDGKSQVSAEFIGNSFRRFTKIVISIQHDEDKDIAELRKEINEKVVANIFAEIDLSETEILINPSGKFVIGGIDADTGLTGRKIVVDAYGPRVAVGGGAFSGKDASKVDRSGAYMARYIAKNIVSAGLAEKCEITLSYAIGKAEPTSLNINNFETNKVSEEIIKKAVLNIFDLRPAKIIETLKLKTPLYSSLACGGHFGKEGYIWENTDKVYELKEIIRPML